MCKGYKINLPPGLKKELTVFCKQKSDGRTNAHNLLPKGKTIGWGKHKKHHSSCLDSASPVIPEFEPTATSAF
jgi:hypothetical protein